jgi:hypothetical protein
MPAETPGESVVKKKKKKKIMSATIRMARIRVG